MKEQWNCVFKCKKLLILHLVWKTKLNLNFSEGQVKSGNPADTFMPPLGKTIKTAHMNRNSGK